jgi:hypothetical protein
MKRSDHFTFRNVKVPQVICGLNCSKFLSPSKFHAYLLSDGRMQARDDLDLHKGATSTGSHFQGGFPCRRGQHGMLNDFVCFPLNLQDALCRIESLVFIAVQWSTRQRLSRDGWRLHCKLRSNRGPELV